MRASVGIGVCKVYWSVYSVWHSSERCLPWTIHVETSSNCKVVFAQGLWYLSRRAFYRVFLTSGYKMCHSYEYVIIAGEKIGCTQRLCHFNRRALYHATRALTWDSVFVVISKWHPYLVTFNENLDHRLFNKRPMGWITPTRKCRFIMHFYAFLM